MAGQAWRGQAQGSAEILVEAGRMGLIGAAGVHG
jgi:hypothetical protein